MAAVVQSNETGSEREGEADDAGSSASSASDEGNKEEPQSLGNSSGSAGGRVIDTDLTKRGDVSTPPRKRRRQEDRLIGSGTQGTRTDDDSDGRHETVGTQLAVEEDAKAKGEASAQRDGDLLDSSNTEGILQHRWETMFQRLVAFKEKHGHCLVPNRYPEDRSLGAWVSTQRRHYKNSVTAGDTVDFVSTPLTAERVRRLQAVGFVWATSDPRHTPWEIRFEQLREYKEQHGT